MMGSNFALLRVYFKVKIKCKVRSPTEENVLVTYKYGKDFAQQFLGVIISFFNKPT